MRVCFLVEGLEHLIYKALLGLKETDIAMDQDTKLLASLFKGKLSPWVIKNIEDRDPNLLKTLDNFKSKYDNSWPEPNCEQKRM